MLRIYPCFGNYPHHKASWFRYFLISAIFIEIAPVRSVRNASNGTEL